jgi:hypothetical protein
MQKRMTQPAMNASLTKENKKVEELHSLGTYM